MEAGVFSEIGLILVLATIVAGIARWLRQPLIIGHIITGILVGPFVFNLVRSTHTLETFSNIGIAFLLFIIGLGLNPKVIKEVGKIALVTGSGQIIFTSAIGFGLARLLGFSTTPAIYLALALAFSSTIIILKLLSDKREQNLLYGKISTGFLLVQDVVAVLILIFVSALGNHASGLELVISTMLKGGLLVVSLGLASVYILPRLANFFAHSQEFLFLFAIGWGLGVASLFAQLDFSIEIGALAAGVALATSPYSLEISSRLRPLRDFFIILFFIILGAGLSFENITQAVSPALAFSALVLIGNPLIVMALMGALGYRRKTSFKAGLTVAQISEFSLILILLGNRVGHLPADILGIITLVAIITIAGSTYLMIYDDELYKLLEPVLKWFERSRPKETLAPAKAPQAVLFGYESGGYGFVKAFEGMGKSFLVVDYNPESIDHLEEKQIPARYGDANDSEFLDELGLDRVKLVVINLSDYSANALIVDRVRAQNPQAIVIATVYSDKPEEALELYDRGASYVIMPRYLGSKQIEQLLKRFNLRSSQFKAERQKHQQFLQAASLD